MQFQSILLSFIFFSAAVYAVRVIDSQWPRACITQKDCNTFQLIDPLAIAECFVERCICFSKILTRDCRTMNPETSEFVFGSCPCSVINSECQDGFCFCNPGYRPSEDMRRCIPHTLPVGGHCEIDEQCQKNNVFTICDRSDYPFECKCRHNYVRVNNGECRALMDNHKATPCYRDDDCKINRTNAQCALSINRCVCAEGLVNEPFIHNCTKPSEIGDSCSFNEQCEQLSGTGAQCYKEQCLCKDKHKLLRMYPHLRTSKSKYNKYSCVFQPGLGDSCLNNFDCSSEKEGHPQPLHCVRARCKCRLGYAWKTDIICKIDYETSSKTVWFTPGKIIGCLLMILIVMILIRLFVKFSYVFNL